MTTSNSGISQFYIPESRLALIEKVKASLQLKKIVALEGEDGIGKTAMLEEVLTNALPNANKCYVTATKTISDVQIRSRIIEQLFGNVLFDPEMPLLTSFIEFNNPSEIFITIDNCHYLSGRIIGELLQLFSESSTLGLELNLVLAFNRNKSSTLLNVNSGFLQVMPVPALNKQESYQLMVEYIADIPAQTHSKVKRWIENSGGVPIQLLAFNEHAALENQDNLPLNLKFWGALLVMTSLLLTLGVYVYRINVNAEQVQQQEAEEGSSLLTQKVVKPWAGSTVKTSEQDSVDDQQNENHSTLPTSTFSVEERPIANMVAKPAATGEVIFDALMANTQTVNEQNKSANNIESSIARDVEDNPTTNMILAELTKTPVQETEIEQDKQAPQEDQAPQERQAKQKVGDNKTALSSEITPNVNNKSTDKNSQNAENEDLLLNQKQDNELDLFMTPEPEVGTTTTSSKVNTSADNTEEQQVPTPTIDEQNEAELKALLESEQIIATRTEQIQTLEDGTQYRIDNQQFMALPNDHYVLQLTAVSSQTVLAEYLNSAPVDVESLRIYQVRRNGTQWIVVTYGLFDSIQLARTEAQRVAPNAWAKSVSVIQQQITAYQNTIENP